MLLDSLSLFERLPRVLFIAICHYLPLEHKLSKLITLNHLVKQSFLPLACCRYDTVKLVVNRLESPRYAIIQYMNVVRHIHIDAEGTINSTVLAAIKRAVANPLLESLHVSQRTIESQRNLAMVVLDVLAGLDSRHPSNLKQLSLQIHDEYDRAGINWNGLKNCTSLQSLSLALADGPYLGMQMQGLTELFPPSLTHLRVLSTATNSELRYDIWKAALSSSEFLPHLQRLDLVNSSGFNKSQLDVLSSTVMSSTGEIRPMRSIKVFGTDALPDLNSFIHLTSISFRIQPQVIPLVASLLRALLNQLTSFNVELALSPDDRADSEINISPLLTSLCSPSIRDARITLNMEEGGVIQPLSHDALIAMYGMKSLEYLEIIPFVLDSSSGFVAPPSHCWPKLRSIKLSLKNCTNSCFDRLLESAPAVTLANIALLNEPSIFNQLTCVTFVSVIALLGVHCQRVKAINISMPDEDVYPMVTRDQILNSQVGEYLADASFKELISLNVRCAHSLIEDNALPILIKKLSKSTKLIECSLGQNMSKLQLCMLRALPHLSFLSHIPDESIYYSLNRTQPSPNFDVEMETDDSDIDYDDDEVYYDEDRESDNEQHVLEDEYLYLEDAPRYSRSPFTPEDFSDESVLAKLGSAPSLRFSHVVRERWIDTRQEPCPLDGRQAFFQSLFDSLSVKDRTALCQMDQSKL